MTGREGGGRERGRERGGESARRERGGKGEGMWFGNNKKGT